MENKPASASPCTRRILLTALLVASLLVFFAPCSLLHASSRPNILFIMTDDHAYQAVGAYGSNRNKTPNIDRIAKQGVRFDRCYVTNSLCGPSRACILTGMYGHKNGFIDNHSSFDGSQTTLPKLLKSAGYQTAIVGKWHLISEPTGFDYWDVLPGQGQYYRPDFISQGGRRAVPGYVTDVTTDLALEWLREKRDSSKPFLLMVQHKAPHRRWEPAAEKLEKFSKQTFSEPASLLDDYSNRGAAAHRAEMRISQMVPNSDVKLWKKDDQSRQFQFNRMSKAEQAEWAKYVDPRLAEFEKANPEGDNRTRAFYQLYMRDYMACVESVDDSVGKLLDYLDESGLADNTIVVYTSDQGFYLGEHGWFDKRFMYEESLRTPLVMRWPGVTTAGEVEERIVSNVDFAPTFLEAAGVEVPEMMQGRSLAPLARGESPEDWRKSFYYHYYEGFEREHKVYKHEGVTTGRAKLINFYPIGEWELYDLEKDPHEMVNVYGKPEYAAMQKELHAELDRLREELEVPPNEVGSSKGAKAQSGS